MKDAKQLEPKLNNLDGQKFLERTSVVIGEQELEAHFEVGLPAAGRKILGQGGSNGLGEAVKKRSDQEISFGTLTYPHQMMKVMLLEQIFRVNKILRNENYHK